MMQSKDLTISKLRIENNRLNDQVEQYQRKSQITGRIIALQSFVTAIVALLYIASVVI